MIDQQIANVESFYPLSPMQQGMLFHSLFEPSTGMYIELMSVQLKGKLNIPFFIQSWRDVLARHPILRTAFLWEGIKEPVQVVYQQVDLKFPVLDWRQIPQQEQQDRITDYLREERAQGFDLTRAPLMRLALVQIAEQEYYFIWTHHHILVDGWSIPLLLNEVLTIYASLAQGIEPVLPKPRPYRDYIVWLRRQNLQQSEIYWKEKLAGITAPTPIPVAGLEKENLTIQPEFSEVEEYLPNDISASIQLFARQNGLTLNTLLQGAWAILLSRYSGEEDVLFGCTVSGRPADLAGSELMLGLFINTLPVHVQVDGKCPLKTFLKTLQSQLAEMRQYEYTPLVQIQGWSEMPRGIPLFDSILVFENFPLGEISEGPSDELVISGGQSASHTNFPLTVVGAPGEEISLKISYNQLMFSKSTIQRMLRHLYNILIGMVKQPDQPISGLVMLTANEKKLLLEEWNKREASYPAVQCIHEWFETQVASDPDSVALTFEGQSLTYNDLNQRANHLAHFLIDSGIGPESMVGIFLERNLDLVVTILGILKAGAAYVPLDPTYPPDRLAFIIEDYSRVNKPDGIASTESISDHDSDRKSIVITQQSKLQDLPRTEAQIIVIDSQWPEIIDKNINDFGPGYTLPNPKSGVIPENLAYVIYTSGSTGKPKGVMVTHANVVRLFDATDAWYHFDRNDVWTLFHSYAFDFSVWEIWGALLYGGRLVVVPYLTSRAPHAFYHLLCDEGVTVLNQTPSAFRQLIRAEEELMASAEGEGYDLGALRYMIFGGEALELQSLKSWFERHGDLHPKLVNMYGITETTVHVTYRPIYSSDLGTAPGSVIGRAIPDLEIYILDKDQQPVPVGIPGELYVGGAGVARGYLNRPDLTDQRFVFAGNIPPLANRKSNGRIYRTGDLARYLSGGDIEYLGRIDHQVKIRGFRIELGEIESVLAQYPGVRESIVLAREDDGHKRLVAFIVLRDDKDDLSITDLRQAISQKLPDYMVPSAFFVIKSLPLTANGKVDRRALLSEVPSSHVQLSRRGEFIPPADDDEIAIANLWQQLLGVEKVGLLDNFFELGGDSILSIQFISRAHQAGIQVSYHQLFEHPVLHDLVASLGSEAADEGHPDIASGPVSITPIQHWYFEHHKTHPEQFNTSIMFEVWQEVDLEALQESLYDLMDHHDALRTRFKLVDDVWHAEVPESIERTTFERVSIKSKNEDRIVQEIHDYANQAQASFDLGSGPLVKAILFQPGAEQPSRLLFIFHHLVFDGVSMRIFIEDFLSSYLQRINRQPVNLPAKTTSYRSWGERLINYADSFNIKKEIDYWLTINSKSIATIPLDYPNGSNTYGETDTITLTLGEEDTTDMMHGLTSYYDVSVHTILLTAWLCALRRWTGMQNFYIEMEGHGREEISDSALQGVDLSRTIGWFTSIYPVYMELGDSDSISLDLHSIEDQIRGIPNRGIGYGVMRYLLPDQNLRRQFQNLPDPELNFNYLGVFDQTGVEIEIGDVMDAIDGSDEMVPFALSNDSVGLEQSPDAMRSAKLYIVAAIGGNQLGIRWLFSRGLHKAETIQRVAEYTMQELVALIKSLRR